MDKYCPCGETIPGRNYLCQDCAQIYGLDKDEWPSWLSFQIFDIHKEYRYEARHEEWEYLDSIDYKGNLPQQHDPTMGWGPYFDYR